MRFRPGYSEEEVSDDGLVASRGPSDRANLMHLSVSRKKWKKGDSNVRFAKECANMLC